MCITAKKKTNRSRSVYLLFHQQATSNVSETLNLNVAITKTGLFRATNSQFPMPLDQSQSSVCSRSLNRDDRPEPVINVRIVIIRLKGRFSIHGLLLKFT
ncbi:hypothetical protein CEXT_603581 [Caerostris extrusa]|uniref:Uncharacterized protein n=1 Tax=Caerostris extrusa TaxID=172846 RepID=A0AAV4PT60_CAEEX|nr:hypothetical protein CEXT_603581 [Caerostris extrusa]